MIPAVPFILRGALALIVMFLALVLNMIVIALDKLTEWLVPEAGARSCRNQERVP